jgi:predicted dinucleotide-binding enzyme
MKIGVIGIGNIGGTIARKLAAVGHEVRVANSKGADAARPFADEIGATATDRAGAVEGADVIILSVPFPAIRELPKDLFANVPRDVPIVDTGNYYPGARDPQIAELDAGKAESLWVADQIGRPVIKAFNNILAHALAEFGRPVGSPGRLAVAVAGDDVAAKRIVMNLVNEVGFDPVDAGPLEECWRQQPGTPAYCCDDDVMAMRKGLADAVRDEAPKRRDALMGHLMTLSAFPNHEELVALNRRFYAID